MACMKTALICGSDGFVGGHLCRRLVAQGYKVQSIGLTTPRYGDLPAKHQICDLRIPHEAEQAFALAERLAADGSTERGHIDEVYHLAADMGGIGFISSNFATICRNNTRVTLNVLDQCVNYKVGKVFYAGSACCYPLHAQHDAAVTALKESDAFPANAEKGYGWEKLYGELLFSYYAEEFGLNVRIARFHNIFGEKGAWTGGREKAPAAACRKVAESQDGDIVEIWGDGAATRSFCYIVDCLDGVQKLMASDYTQPLNIGSDVLVTVDELYRLVAQISRKSLRFIHLPEKPQGVRGRNSNNDLVKSVLDWSPQWTLKEGLVPTYNWISEQVERAKQSH